MLESRPVHGGTNCNEHQALLGAVEMFSVVIVAVATGLITLHNIFQLGELKIGEFHSIYVHKST